MNEKHHLDATTLERLLAGDVLPEVEAHLAVCASCRQAWEHSLRAHRWLQRGVLVPAPPGFQAKVMQRVEELSVGPTPVVAMPPIAWWGLLAVTAAWAVVLVALLGLLLYGTFMGPAIVALWRALAHALRGWAKIAWAVWRATDMGVWTLAVMLLAAAGVSLWLWVMERVRARLSVVG